MVILYVLLLLLYVGLTGLYFWTQPQATAVPSWPQIGLPPRDPEKITTCSHDADCQDPHSVCLGSTCVPKLLRGEGECDPAHGQWISYAVKGGVFAVCVCTDDRLFSQKVFGGDCNVNVACGPHGRYVPLPGGGGGTCDCDPGYVAAPNLECQKVPLLEYMKSLPCEQNELHVSSIREEDGFHAEYLRRRIATQKCVKRPCSFDALSGRPLKYGKYKHNWGCVCDPKYGLFGVVLEGLDKKYLSSPGFDACASIFEKDPTEPIDVKLVTYFYLEKREPISLLLFDRLKDAAAADLLPVFRERGGGGGPLMLRQSLWRYDYAQHFFREHEHYHARTRKVYKDPMFGMEVIDEALYHDHFKPAYCSDTHRVWLAGHRDRVAAYLVLYKSPVCKIHDQDANADPMFRGRTVVNPNHVTFQDYPELQRFNAFVLHYDAAVGRWSLDLDYPFQTDLYRSINTNAPVYP